MIKNAKAGDVIFRLEYDEEDKTCDITQHVVVFDQRTGTSLCVNDNVEDDTTLKSPRHILLSPTQVFRTYKQAYNTYVNYLKQDLVLANKTVALTTDILSKIVKPKSKKKVQQSYEMYIADYCSVCGKRFNKEKEHQYSGPDVNVKWFGLDFCGECVSLPYNLLLIANKRLDTYRDGYGTWTFDNYKEHPKLKLRIKQEKESE